MWKAQRVHPTHITVASRTEGFNNEDIWEFRFSHRDSSEKELHQATLAVREPGPSDGGRRSRR
ncbi:uncharacterized protein LOC142769374 isoform X2 [Rhipicephalus microplus]|uniref:uncharacterized protein LOC142769374 isoform X2 n=1 Tax=Rhipicephalus microplus TaxID=6941 RepID=UPI003F6BB1A3